MSTEVQTEEIMQQIREHRSSEDHYPALLQLLDKTITNSQQANDTELATNLQEVKEKYTSEYEKARETGGSAWPEFEKFVTQFERVLSNASKT